MGKMRKLLMFAMVVVISGMVFGYAAKHAVGQEPYKIGQIGSITGFGSYYGIIQREAALLAVEDINKKGGINGHPIKLTVYDNESDTTKGVLAVKKLIEVDDALIVFGPNMTGDFKAVIPIYEEKNVVGISTSGSAAVGLPTKKWIFQISNCSDWAAYRRVEFCKERGWTKIGLLTENSALAMDESGDCKKAAAKLGVQVIVEETMGPTDLDMSPQLVKIAAAKPDAILATGSSSLIIAAKNRKTLGIKIPFAGGGTLATYTFINVAKDAAEGVFVGGAGLLTAPDQIPASHICNNQASYIDKLFMEKYKKHADSYAGNIWDPYLIVFEALKRSGPDRVKLRDEIEKTKNFVGVQGVFTFSPEIHRGPGVEYLAMYEVVGGKFKLASLRK
jgi:branched-chain amino acid transport system substrate-binding protein